MEPPKNEKLWRIAQHRAAFKKNLYSYIIVNTFLWAVWWFSADGNEKSDNYPWPIWVMLGWGVGLAMQYFKAYNGDKQHLAEQEYERLKNQ